MKQASQYDEGEIAERLVIAMKKACGQSARDGLPVSKMEYATALLFMLEEVAGEPDAPPSFRRAVKLLLDSLLAETRKGGRG